MTNIANQIIKSKESIKSNIVLNIFAVIFSILSIVFSLSIIIELAKQVNGLVLIGVSILIITVLIFTEIIKVQQLMLLFKKERYSLFMLVLTHLISIGLSGIGIYFFTDKSATLLNESNLNNAKQIALIESEYKNKIDSINNLSIQSNIEYIDLNKSLQYWKSRKASDIAERNNIRSQIQTIEANLNNLNIRFNDNKKQMVIGLDNIHKSNLVLASVNSNIDSTIINKSLFLTSILIGLTLFIKIFIIFIAYARAEQIKSNNHLLNSELANRFKLFYSALKYFYALKGQNKTFYMNEFSKDIPFLIGKWDSDTKHLVNFLINNKIIKINLDPNIKGDKGKILMPESEAIKLLTDTYNVLLTNPIH